MFGQKIFLQVFCVFLAFTVFLTPSYASPQKSMLSPVFKSPLQILISEADHVTRMLGQYQTTGPEENAIPDVFLVPGHPHALTIIEFAKQYKAQFNSAKEKPYLYFLGGHGNGTSRLVEGVISYYYPKDSDRDEDRNKIEDPDVSEAEIIEIIFKKEGVVDPSRIRLETKSTDTEGNFIKAKEMFQKEFDLSEKTIHLRIVTDSGVVLRQYEYAWKNYKDEIKDGSLQLSATYSVARKFSSLKGEFSESTRL